MTSERDDPSSSADARAALPQPDTQCRKLGLRSRFTPETLTSNPDRSCGILARTTFWLSAPKAVTSMKRAGSPPSFLAALTTAPSAEAAKRLVKALVERRLIACGTLLPGAVSTYWWQGAVAEEEEVVVILKTTAARWAELAATLPGLHPCEVPELIALPVAGGHQPYLDWVRAETAAPKPRRRARAGKRKRKE
jgi:periplasmic divalent cation tolerance protein